MAFDSAKSLKNFLLIVILLTVFVLMNMIGSLVYLYRTVKVSFLYQNYDKPAIIVENRTHGYVHPSQQTTIYPLMQNTTTPAKPDNRQDVCKHCFRHNFEYLIQNKAICDTINGHDSVEFVAFVFTVHDHFKQRDVLRKTWLSVTKANTGRIRYLFLLGNTNDEKVRVQVEVENKQYHDIVMESFKDSYNNLTYKTIMGFKWVTQFCPQARFVMKTDDDMYVNLTAILTLLKKEEKALQITLSGACALTAGPIRNKHSKWYASIRSYPHARYPGFCSGTGYVTSMAVARQVYNVSADVPFFHLEDVYVSLCIKKLGYTLRALRGFHNYRTLLDPCDMKSGRILTSHEVPMDFILKTWNTTCS